MATVCETLTLSSGDSPPSLATVEETFANALIVGAFLAFTVGDPAANVTAEVKTPYDPETGEIEVCYDDAALPDGVTELAGNFKCPRDCWAPGGGEVIITIERPAEPSDDPSDVSSFDGLFTAEELASDSELKVCLPSATDAMCSWGFLRICGTWRLVAAPTTGHRIARAISFHGTFQDPGAPVTLGTLSATLEAGCATLFVRSKSSVHHVQMDFVGALDAPAGSAQGGEVAINHSLVQSGATTLYGHIFEHDRQGSATAKPVSLPTERRDRTAFHNHGAHRLPLFTPMVANQSIATEGAYDSRVDLVAVYAEVSLEGDPYFVGSQG